MRPVLVLAAVLAFAAPAFAQEAPETYPVPEVTISSDLSALPEAVRATRDKLIAAARSGDIEQLRPIIAAQANPPQVSYGDAGDPVEYLTTYSADGGGAENLAILLDLLDAPYAVLDAGSDDPSYVWPYLAVMDNLADLTPAQKVDAYRILTPDQLQELIDLEAWYYWRVYIGKNGEWQAFVAGD